MRKYCIVFLFLSICVPAFGRSVDLQDRNLRDAIARQLNLSEGAQITEANMEQLTHLNLYNRNIQDLTGLEYAINLTYFEADKNRIVDLTPLANLTKLVLIRLNENRVTDITPLAKLTQLVELYLDNNHIVDVGGLAGLTQLEVLVIYNNRIADYSPLDRLTLGRFIYDQSCEMPRLPLASRLANRSFPSVFYPWGNVVNQPHLWDAERRAQHDLYFCCVSMFGQHYFNTGHQWEVRGNLDAAIRRRDEHLMFNLDMIFIAEIRMRDEGGGYPPPDSPSWVWLHDDQGNVIYDEGRRLVNFTHPRVQDMIVQQAIAVSKCGLYDGVFFDWWGDDNSSEQRARENIVRRIREATQPDFLIMGNTNDRIIPRTAPYINGGFMESVVFQNHMGDELEKRLTRVESSLRWLEQNLREPRINALQGGSNPDEPPDSPTNLRYMRAITTLGLTHSDGYVQFAIGITNSHYWYDFWDADLGRPVGAKAQLYDEGFPGLYIREFTNGWAVYNHSGAEQVVRLHEDVVGVSSRLEGMEHTLPNLDGEIYLRVTVRNPADVNGDGAVNIFDLTLVAQAIGTAGAGGDVNGDGVVNVFDLVLVANAF